MSTESVPISQEQARQKAQETLMFQIGNLPHLGDSCRVGSDYVFPIYLRQPRVIFDETNDHPVDVKFMSQKQVGTICVQGESGDVSRTDLPRINRRIRQINNDLEEAVQQALVHSSAQYFSRLPFPTHRYTPILDILSHLLLEGPIEEAELARVITEDDRGYFDYVDQLRDVDLVRVRNGLIEAGSVLIGLQSEDLSDEEEQSENSKRLNAALAHFFREGSENIDTIRQILGPYLVLSGYYYKRALDLGETIPVSEAEFKNEIEEFYSGQNGLRKRFKVSRYLIQLEEVGLLEASSDRSSPAWKGDDIVIENLIEDNLLETESGLAA